MHVLRFATTATCIVLMCGLGAAAAASPPSEDDLAFAVRRFGLRDGLPQGSVTDVVIGPDHRLWMTTFGGIATYDGVEFTQLDMAVEPALPSNRFLSAAVAGEVLWFGTETNGLVKRNPDGTFIAVPLPAPLTDRVVWDLAADPRGGVWVAAETGVAYVHPDGTIDTYAIPKGPTGVQAVAVAPTSAGLLVGTSVGLLRLDNGALQPATLGGETTGGTWVIGEDSKGAIWGGGKQEVWRFADGQMRRWSNRSWNLHFAEDGAGGTWWHDADGLMHIVADGQVKRAQVDGLSTENRALNTDFEGNLWLGSGSKGLFHLEPRRMALWAAPNPAGHPGILPVAEARDGTIWTGGTCGPLTRWSESGPMIIPLPHPDGAAMRPPCFQELLSTADGRLWAVSEEDIWWIDTEGPTPTAQLALHLPPDEPRIRTAALSPAGALVLSRAGLELEVAALDPSGTVQLRPIGRPDLPRPRAGLVFGWDPRGDLWVAAEGELTMLPAAGGTAQRWTVADGLPRGLPRAMHITGTGELWIGTYGGGLALLREGALRRVSTRHGLVENIVSNIVFDAQGGMWLNGNRGVSWVPPAEVDAFRAGTSRDMHAVLYAEGEGNGGSLSAGARTRSGRVLMPTAEGLRVIRPEAIRPERTETPVVFVGAEAAGAELPMLDGRVTVPAGADDIAVQFRALSFSTGDRLRFRHRLDGWEGRWVQVGTSRTARYTNLPPGSYELRLQAQGTDGVWTDADARLHVVVLPAWHQRAWVRVSGLGLLAAAAVGLWGSRTRTLRRRNDDLTALLHAQRVADAETRGREQRYRSVFEHARNGFLLHRVDGTLLDLNHAAAALLGASPAKLRQAPPLSFIEPDERDAWRALLEAAAADHTATAEVWARRGTAHGESGRFLMRADARKHVLPGENAILIAIEDRSAALAQEAERMQLQRTVEQAGRLDAVGRLAGGVAHDFNNELTAILLQTEALRGETLGAAGREGLRTLEASARRAAAITRSLLSFSRGQLLEPRPVELHAAIESMRPVLSGFAQGEGTRALRIAPAEGEVWVLADPTQVSQVVINLVINALDAIGSNGTVEVRARAVQLPEGQPELPPGQAPGAYGVLEIRDDGPGMSAEVQARALEPFFTTKPLGKGTGLGLAQVHGITAQSGGFLRIDSAPGAGCTVRVHLPRPNAQQQRATAQAAAPISTHAARDGAGQRVLLCDDNPAVLRAAESALTRGGFAVTAHESPLDALRALTEADPGAWTLLLTDVRMPELDGPALARAAQTLDPALRVLFVSGYADVKVDDDELGWVLAKPFTPRALLDRVWARLDAPVRARDPERSA